MELLSFVGILVGVGVFIFLSFKGNNLAVSSGVGALVILMFSGLPLLSSLIEFWVTGLSGALKSYFLIFILGGVFGKVVDVSGAAKSITYALLKVIRRSKNNTQVLAVYFLILLYFIFTYVGIHAFIIVFTLLPIGRVLYHDLNLPWRFYCYGSGGVCPAYYLMGSVAAPPVLASQITGSNVGAAPVLSILMVVVYLAVIMLIVKWDVTRNVNKGEEFLPTGEEIWKQELTAKMEEDNLPSLFQALTPMVLVVVLAASGITPVVALVVGTLAGIIVMFNRLKPNLKNTINTGAVSVFGALINVCGAAALGTVMKNVAGYTYISNMLDSVEPMYAGVLLAIFGTTLLGSGSACLPAFGPQIAEYFSSAGLTSDASFRLLISSSSFIYPPHNTGVVNASATAKVPYSAAALIYLKGSAIPNAVVIVVTMILISLGVF